MTAYSCAHVILGNIALSMHFKTIADRIIVFGQTFPHKESIKGLGGRFNGVEKTWHLPLTPANMAGIRALCEAVGGGELTPATLPSPSLATTNDDSLPPWDLDTSLKKQPLQAARTDTLEASAPEASGLTISQLMLQISQVVTRGFPTPVWIVGEIQNFAMRSNAFHFNLADAKEGSSEVATVTAKAAAWPGPLAYMRDRHGADKLRELFADGIRIRCLCRVTLYKDRGQITLTVEDVDPAFTKGELALAREKLLRELRAKGLDRTNKDLTLAAFPFRLGLISAEGSRAESDFLHQLTQGGFPGTILYVSAKMQGDKVPGEVTSAMVQLTKRNIDALVITRGGGSAADLRWFDSPDIAYAIAQCKVPVIAAIGHHDDVCVAEEICFQRQKTPTAAAQFFLDWFAGTRDRIADLAEKVVGNVSQRLESHYNNLQRLNLELVEQSQGSLNRANISLTTLSGNLHRSGDIALQNLREVLFNIDKILSSSDPKPWLAKGWTQLTSKGGPVLQLADISVGDELKARLIDGILNLSVTEIQKKGARPNGQKSR